MEEFGLSQREVDCAGVLAEVVAGQLRQRRAAEVSGLSTRQMKLRIGEQRHDPPGFLMEGFQSVQILRKPAVAVPLSVNSSMCARNAAQCCSTSRQSHGGDPGQRCDPATPSANTPSNPHHAANTAASGSSEVACGA